MYLEKDKVNSVDELATCINDLYSKHGASIYIMKRKNGNGTYTVYAYKKDCLYTARPQQPRKKYKPRVNSTDRPRGPYKKKLNHDEIIAYLRSVLGDGEVLDAIRLNLIRSCKL